MNNTTEMPGTEEISIPPHLPVIETDKKHLPTLTQKAFDALEKANNPPKYFLRGGLPVELGRDHGLSFKLINQDRMTSIMARVAIWVKATKDGPVPVFPLPEVVRDMFNTSEIRLPKIDFVAEVPILTASGEILTKSGYHQAHQTYLKIGIEIPAVPENPTEGDVRQARDLLFETVCDFPFEGASDKAHALAAMILPFVRPRIKGPTPLHDFDAPTPGSGKSLLAEVMMMPFTGEEIRIDTLPHDEPEMGKKITSCLSQGRNIVALDNARGVVDSGKLAAVLTATTWTDRILGSTRMIDCPNTAVWILTGNNVRMSGEITRRTIRCRLDPKVEHPEDRTNFKHPNLKEWIIESRPRLIHAVLVLVRHWQVQGSPGPNDTLGSFEAWSHVVGGILTTADIPGFLGDRQKLREESDAESGVLRAFVQAWFEKFGRQTVKTSDLFPLAEGVDGFPLGNGNEQARKTALGKRLRGVRNRIVVGHKIACSGTGHGGATFYFLGDPKSTPPSPPSHPETDRTTLSGGGVTVGSVVGSDSTPPKSGTTPPSDNGSGSSFGDDGWLGGVKTSLPEEKISHEIFEEVD